MEAVQPYLSTFGRYQQFLYLLCLAPGILSGSETLTYNWTGYTPRARLYKL
jgi:hypothetical protein